MQAAEDPLPQRSASFVVKKNIFIFKENIHKWQLPHEEKGKFSPNFQSPCLQFCTEK